MPYDESEALINYLVNLDIFNSVTGLFQLSLGDLFFTGAVLSLMFLTAVKFQNLSISAVLGMVVYAVFFTMFSATSRLMIGLALALFVGYSLYQAYTREDQA